MITYGLRPGADWQIVDPLPTPMGIDFDVVRRGERFHVRLGQPGLHNARNAAAALAMTVELGGDGTTTADALSSFGGVGRRFEHRGSADGVTLIDDYAHLPTEVAAALQAAASTNPDRLVAVFQPHRFSRTEQLWSTFTDSFRLADVLIVTGIYPSGEAPRPGIVGSLISDDVAAAHPDADVRYVETLDGVVDLLIDELRSGDLCLTLGAGDLTTVPDRLLAGLEARE